MRASSVDQIIIETLSKEHAHLTSLQVFEEIRLRLPAVNQSTVYRALERLVKIARFQSLTWVPDQPCMNCWQMACITTWFAKNVDK